MSAKTSLKWPLHNHVTKVEIDDAPKVNTASTRADLLLYPEILGRSQNDKLSKWRLKLYSSLLDLSC